MYVKSAIFYNQQIWKQISGWAYRLTKKFLLVVLLSCSTRQTWIRIAAWARMFGNILLVSKPTEVLKAERLLPTLQWVWVWNSSTLVKWQGSLLVIVVVKLLLIYVRKSTICLEIKVCGIVMDVLSLLSFLFVVMCFWPGGCIVHSSFSDRILEHCLCWYRGFKK